MFSCSWKLSCCHAKRSRWHQSQCWFLIDLLSRIHHECNLFTKLNLDPCGVVTTFASPSVDTEHPASRNASAAGTGLVLLLTSCVILNFSPSSVTNSTLPLHRPPRNDLLLLQSFVARGITEVFQATRGQPPARDPRYPLVTLYTCGHQTRGGKSELVL